MLPLPAGARQAPVQLAFQSSKGTAPSRSAQQRIKKLAYCLLQVIEPLFSLKVSSVTNEGTFKNNEFVDVYLVTAEQRIPQSCMRLQDDEVQGVKYLAVDEARSCFTSGNPAFVPMHNPDTDYAKLFEALKERQSMQGAGGGSWVPVSLKDSMTVRFFAWQTAQAIAAA